MTDGERQILTNQTVIMAALGNLICMGYSPHSAETMENLLRAQTQTAEMLGFKIEAEGEDGKV